MKKETRTFPSFTAHCLNNLITVTSLHLRGFVWRTHVCALMHLSEQVHHIYTAHLNYLFMIFVILTIFLLNYQVSITVVLLHNMKRVIWEISLSYSWPFLTSVLHICGAGVGSIQSTRLLIFHVLNPLLSILLLNYMFFYHCLTACIIDSLSNFHFKGPERYENVMEAVHVTPVVQL